MTLLRSRLLVLAVTTALCAPLAAQTPPVVAVPGATPAASTASAASASPGASHTLNLKAADIGVLIETVSQITGKSFIVDPRVEGRVTVISTTPQSASEIYETFLSVLRVHGFAAVSAGDMVKIVPDAIAMQDGSVGNGGGGPDALVTRVVDLKHVSAPELAQLLRPLAPQQATLAAAGPSSLLITDRAGNVERLVNLIRRIDLASDAEVEVIALRHASAAEVARTLTSLEASNGAAPGASKLKLIADDRTNSVLLSGDPGQRLRLRSLIAHLDTPLDGGENTQVIYLHYARASDLMPILDSVAGTLTGFAPAAEGQAGAAKAATIQAHEETNALVVTSSPAVFRELAAVVRQLDIRRPQVLVEAVIAEVTDELADEFGVQWQSTSLDGVNDTGVIGGTNFGGASGLLGSIAGGAGGQLGTLGSNGLNLGYVGGSVTLPIGPNGADVTVLQVGALVKALRGDTRANVISSPSVVTLDHTEAEFKVVQEVPFLTGQYTNTSTNGGANQPTNPFQTVERKDVGLILTVTPHINEGDSVRLDIKQDLSALAPNISGAVDLITTKREFTNSVLVPDGGMLVLGGLKAEDMTQNVQGVPGLSRIPLLGNLFKSRRSGVTKRNLMVFLRPIILRDAATEATVSNEKYNYLRAEQLRMRENRELKYRDQQPVLPALPNPHDLMRNPPPMDGPVPRAQDAQERPPPPPPPMPSSAPSAPEAGGDAPSTSQAAPRAPRRIPGHPVARVARNDGSSRD
jgi:general secretion pathway protein D